MSLPKRMPTLKDTVRTQMLHGRIRLSYEPPRTYKGVNLDDENLDSMMVIKQFRMADVRLCWTYNILEDWRIIDEEVMNSDLKEAKDGIAKILGTKR